MASNISLLTPSFINQNVSVTSAAAPTIDFDYELTFTNADINSIFSTKTFQQNGANPNAYDVSLAASNSGIWAIANSATVGISPAAGVSGTGCVAGTSSTLGSRLLEIIAIKIFGHAKARAAIVNDTDFTAQAIVDNLATSMTTALTTDAQLVFQQYVRLDRVELNADDDVTVAKNFNFEGLEFSFPVYFTGNLVSSPGSEALRNGPTTVGGAFLVEGAYNIPLKLTFAPAA